MLIASHFLSHAITCAKPSQAWALKRGFFTARAARPDIYRAANDILSHAVDGRIVLALTPVGYTAAPLAAMPLQDLDAESGEDMDEEVEGAEEEEEEDDDADEDEADDDDAADDAPAAEAGAPVSVTASAARKATNFFAMLDMGDDDE